MNTNLKMRVICTENKRNMYRKATKSIGFDLSLSREKKTITFKMSVGIKK